MINTQKMVSNIYKIGVRLSILLIILGLIFYSFSNYSNFDYYNNFLSIKEVLVLIFSLKFYAFLYLGIYLIIITPLIAVVFLLVDSLKKGDYKLALLCFLIFFVLGLYLYFS